MATLVRFLKDEDGEVFAFFPQLNYNEDYKTGYAHIGQHTAISKEYAVDCEPALFADYTDLYEELQGIGYNLKVLNR